MAQNIHPELLPIDVKCSSCSNTFQVHTTMKSDGLDIENCFKCSPVYTGKRRANTTGHGSEAFKKRFSGFSSLNSLSTKDDK